ncbi:MAG: SDR family oxidoreductase [Gammaproteobacteria bacterium]|nr:SDR family oxidoreductase [Gammaproteobacteria bacterium]
MKTGLTGRTVIITGAARNIGRETALQFAEEGANLALLTRSSQERLEAVASAVRQRGVKAITGVVDVTDGEAVDAFVNRTLAEFGRLDVLVNNAVYRGESGFLEQSPQEWQRNIGVNLNGPANLCRAVLPHMIEAGFGRIINYSGIAPFLGHGPAKAMVKLGIVGFTRGLASEFGHANITANCIGPGMIDVERDSWQRDKSKISPEQAIPRHGRPEEIASLAVYLASDQAAFITGQCYLANGGRYYL